MPGQRMGEASRWAFCLEGLGMLVRVIDRALTTSAQTSGMMGATGRSSKGASTVAHTGLQQQPPLSAGALGEATQSTLQRPCKHGSWAGKVGQCKDFVQVIIAGAGGAAHLPGMIAALTPLPVIGVPVKPAGAHLDGLDALLSIVQVTHEPPPHKQRPSADQSSITMLSLLHRDYTYLPWHHLEVLYWQCAVPPEPI